jgi:hypothetical protein
MRKRDRAWKTGKKDRCLENEIAKMERGDVFGIRHVFSAAILHV